MTEQIRIEDVVVGEGNEVKKGALITAHYRGLLDDGTEFDSSYEKGRPFQTVLSKNKVIQGWFQGLQGMRVGGTRKLWVPAELARSLRTVICTLKLNYWKPLIATINGFVQSPAFAGTNRLT